MTANLFTATDVTTVLLFIFMMLYFYVSVNFELTLQFYLLKNLKVESKIKNRNWSRNKIRTKIIYSQRRNLRMLFIFYLDSIIASYMYIVICHLSTCTFDTCYIKRSINQSINENRKYFIERIKIRIKIKLKIQILKLN